MHSRSFGGTSNNIREAAEKFCAAILNTGGDAGLQRVYEDGVLIDYRVSFCNHAPRWAIEGLDSPLDHLLKILSQFDEPVRLQYLPSAMASYTREQRVNAIDDGKQLGLITIPANSRSRMTLELTALARDLESLVAQTHQVTTA